MFDSLSDRLVKTIKSIRGQARLTEENVNDAIRDVRRALLEADVALVVVKEFIEKVRARALGAEVLTSLTPSQAFIKIVKDQLQEIMGNEATGLALNASPPVVVLLAGLQGAGKTTTAAKLALWLKQREKKKVVMASCDIYRPAAIEQLKTLSNQVDVDFFKSNETQSPVVIAKQAQEYARLQFADVLIVDTAGRLTVDEAMMTEIKELHQTLQPHETLFVIDSMTGQDAANSAKAFNDALSLTGVILTKTDGDARGGAALSTRMITGKPIKFIGVGEKIDNLELFHPDRIASNILGMGDVLSLVEEAERKIDVKKAEKLAKKITKGKRFGLEDFREQLLQMQNMGGLTSIMTKLPGMKEIPDAVKDKVNDRETVKMIAIINSMTPKERRYPDLLRGSRKKRIVTGSGTQIQDLNKLMKQFQQMQRMMKKASKGGMKSLMRGMKGKLPLGDNGGGGFPF